MFAYRKIVLVKLFVSAGKNSLPAHRGLRALPGMVMIFSEEQISYMLIS